MKPSFPFQVTPGTKTYLRIKVIPRQPRTEYIDTLSDETIRIRLKATPEKGRANTELIRYLAEVLDVSKSGIEIVAGTADPIKLVRVMN